jgi:hypothetical protein
MSSAPPPDEPTAAPSPEWVDPVLVRRRRYARLAELGQRIGYGLYGLSLVLFFVAVATDLPAAIVQTIVVALVLGSAVLAPAIVVAYGVKAADREDRERGSTTN